MESGTQGVGEGVSEAKGPGKGTFRIHKLAYGCRSL